LTIYCISGLGADERVFDFLEVEHELVPIKWITPYNNESIVDYSKRLSLIIDTSKDFCLLAVSFGGLVAVEISKILTPRVTILISSASIRKELMPLYRWIGKSSIVPFIPSSFFDIPRFMASWLFGTKEKKLLNSILDDTDLNFAKWSVNELVNWSNEIEVDNLVRIHGTDDKLISAKGKINYSIEGGAHFMIVDRSNEISTIINEELALI